MTIRHDKCSLVLEMLVEISTDCVKFLELQIIDSRLNFLGSRPLNILPLDYQELYLFMEKKSETLATV